MPTLLQVSNVVNSTSVGRIAEQIGQTAMQEGWDSYITYARNHTPSQSKIIKIGHNLDVYWHGINTRLFDNHGLCSTRATKKLIKQVQQIKPDVILLHNMHGYFLNISVLFNYLATLDTPIIWVLHDCWSFTGHCAYFDYVGCEKWKFQCYDCPQKQEYPTSLWLDKSSRNYVQKKQLFNQVKNMTIVPVSYWLESMVKHSFLNQYPIHVIQNGIDLNMFSPQLNSNRIKEKYGVGNKFLVLGVANIWDRRKGLQDFVTLSRHLGSDCQIVLVGLKKKQLQKLPKGIIGIERTESVQALIELYSAADLFVNPTWEDTFPTTNLEALACGTPVVTYRTGGSVEAVSEDTGFVVDKGDINTLCDVIDIVKQKGKVFYSENCRKRATILYNKNERFDEYMHLFNQLLKQ
ncbi:MAG: glycosyltransferase [Bacteroidales bacterium]|nr:glycosyltransferase [Bacteroidales bacterium]